MGLVLLVIGLAFLLDNLGYMRAHEILQYWPIILIGFGVLKVFESGPTGSRMFGVVLAIVGLLILLDNLDIVYFHIWGLWPLILVLMGASMVWRVFAKNESSSASGDSFLQSSAFMGGGKRSSMSREFRGAQLSAVMGGIQLDLRDAQIQGTEAVIDVFTCCGGVEIRVPQEWLVVTQITPVLGGVDDKTRHPSEMTSKRLILKGMVIMGGAEVKN
jgi:predicted membrane protein